jgi:hypothetical protein
MDNGATDFMQMEQRPGGGGGGAVAWVVGLGLLVLIPAMGYWMGTRETRPAPAAAAVEFEPNRARGEYRLFQDPHALDLSFTFRRPADQPEAICSDPVRLPGGETAMPTCQPVKIVL